MYNEELFFLSHDDYVSPGLSVRVMNIHKFMNSKVRRACHILRLWSEACSLWLDTENAEFCQWLGYIRLGEACL